ncbi:MAG: aromatic ring-hydroxylating dioxygenase subunit alpha [Parvibaculaceae bacterium]
MNRRMDMLARLEGRQPNYSLPQPFYTDPDYFQIDLDEIWYREWLFAGHDCELPKPGSYFTLEVGAHSVIVVRAKDGEIRALHNTCRHRGSRVCTAAKGSATRLVCPYHQWTYELDGSLLFARDMGKGFDPAKFGLKPVHCATVGGYVFVCLSEAAPDFEAFRRTALPYMAPHILKDTKVAHETTIVEKGNWKLVWENNRECYHCAGNHPELCRTFPERPTLTAIAGATSDPEIIAHWQRCEAQGLPSTFKISDDGQYRAMRVPLLRDTTSFTLTGRPAVKRPLGAIATERIGSMLLYHYPTTWNHLLGDHATTFRVLPIGPQQTQVTTKWLVHKDAVEGIDYDVKELTHVWNQTNDQDRRIVEENQRGINSPAYEPGPYAPDHESGVIQFVDWYCNALEPRLRGDVVRLDRVA